MREKRKFDFKLCIAVVIHIVLTFLWERTVFRNVGVNPSGTLAIRNFISDKGEQTLTYVLTHLFAALMIFFMWKLLFFIFSNFKKDYIVFIVLFAVGSLALFVFWPEVLTGMAGFDDNLVTYSCGIRLTPDYWHGVYSSIIYAAMLLVCPFNFFITLYQWGLFLFVLAYIFFRIKASGKGSGYLTFLILLLPAASYIASNGHRMYQFTILVILYTAVIVMDIYEQRERSAFEIFKIALLGAFISVFRSEGIIIGVLLFGIYLLFGVKRKALAVVCRILVFAILFVALYLPGKVGEKKYYGKDYSMINTFDVLRNILNDESSNLSYKGADGDIAALEAVAPLNVIKSGGTDAYRRYNYNVRGNKDINQSGVDTKTGDDFMKAYRNIVLHNPGIYAKTQFNSAMVALGVGKVFEMAEYKGESLGLSDWYYCGWDSGIEDFYRSIFTDNWHRNETRKEITAAVFDIRDRYYSFMKNRKFYIAGIALMIVMAAALFVRGLVAFFKKKDNIKLSIGLISLAGLVSFFAVSVVMPTSATIYFIGSIYALLTVLYVFFCYERKDFFKKSKK
ncbi:MAG: hypothetical protein J5626_01555 [Lachnospiraceae bacterium]|nr:hypothetical protein [Lachnospiraceae bacterium]